jgi:hypothetical protein
MAVPFGLGKILDAIYSSDTDSKMAREKLNEFCAILAGIFIVGGFANFGRVYLFNNACESREVITITSSHRNIFLPRSFSTANHQAIT